MVDVLHGPGVGGEMVDETGQMVVDKMMVSVVREPFPGQSLTVGAQEVLVYTEVV